MKCVCASVNVSVHLLSVQIQDLNPVKLPPRYSMHACLYNFTYAEVGKVVTPGLAAKSSFRWPLRNHFLNKIVGTFSVVLEWVAPQTVNLCFSQPHHCNLFNLGMLFNIRIFCTLLWIPCSTSQSSGNYHTFSVITHPSPEYYTMILYHTTLWPPYIIKQGILFWSSWSLERERERVRERVLLY